MALRTLGTQLGRVVDTITADFETQTDAVTVDLLTSFLEHLGQHLWFIRPSNRRPRP
jgi:DNA-binding ferritin-like protein